MKNGLKVADCDMHVLEPWDLWVKYMDAEFRERAPIGSHENPLDMRVKVEGRVVSSIVSNPTAGTTEPEGKVRMAIDEGRFDLLKTAIDRGFDASSQLHAMDREGIDKTVLFGSRSIALQAVDYDDTRFAAAIARAYNDWLADFQSENPKRLVGAAMVCLHDVEEAIAEVQRARNKLGFVAVCLRPNPLRSRNWHDPVYDPFWAACQDLDIPVCFHEAQASLLPQAVAERFRHEPDKSWTMSHVASHPMEQMYVALCLISGGVLQRFPKLRVAFLEANCSWIPFWLWRMDDHYEARKEWVSRELPMKPSEYFKRQCFASIEAGEDVGRYTVDWLGDDNIIFSTDYPHFDSAYPQAVDTFLSLPMAPETKRKILWDNCARLYGF